MAPTHAHRLAAFPYVGKHRYSLTLCAHDRRRLLVDATLVDSLLSIFLQFAAAERFAVFAYCVMPDHVHLLVEGTSPDSDLRRFVSLAKQATAHPYRRSTGALLWQKSFWDRILRSDEDARAVARYILTNPVRAGLVTHPLDYPYSGSGIYSRDDLMGLFDDV